MEIKEDPAAAPLGDVPANLPVAQSTTLDATPVSPSTTTYINPGELEDESISELTEDMRELENRAHAHHVLLSSDAMRHFIAVCKDGIDRITFLDRVIAEARTSYPSEDGWVVLSLSRMQELCEKAMKNLGTEVPQSTANEIVRTPLGAGSLAEAIVAGDVIAAYRMIEHRPMVALADATADIDAVYRTKQGMEVEHDQISDLLKSSVAELSLPVLENVMRALTTAIDGTYPDELSAVKIAIMKAVDVVKKG